jgi:hypothetical protein
LRPPDPPPTPPPPIVQRQGQPPSTAVLDRIKSVKAFSRVCGGPDKAMEILGAMPKMPAEELTGYLEALRD